MRGAEALFLHIAFRPRRELLRRLAHLLGAMADHQRQSVGASRLCRLHHMRHHRQAGNLVQHLRQGALHARAFAGGEDDGQAGSLGHGMATVQKGWNQNMLTVAQCCTNAVKFR